MPRPRSAPRDEATASAPGSRPGRGGRVFAYQLVVVVDDLAMGVTDVVRGADLVGSTPRQIWLARALAQEPPRYTHVPLVVAQDGARLEKRTAGATVRGLREAGVRPERVAGALAEGLGLRASSGPVTPREVAAAADALVWRREPWRIPLAW
jgi:glutamyl-tRNA synthetase